MIPVGGWAIVAGCLFVNGPDCTGHLATGLVWGDKAGCDRELGREKIPGAQCMQIVGIDEPAADAPVPSGMDEAIRQLDEEVRYGKASR